jgi:hypothetical protein
MAHGTTTISAPVVMPQDIAANLGIPGTDLGDLCTSGAINMWAKYKPIEYNKKGMLEDHDRENANFGIINIPTWSNINKMAAFWFGNRASEQTNAPECGYQPIYWGYQRPTTYKRLSDFSEYPVSSQKLGYYHEAEAPIGQSSQSEYTIDSGGNLRILYDHATGDGSGRTVRLKDLHYPTMTSYDVERMYFGVLMKKVGTTNVYAVTGPKIEDLGTMGAYVDISGLTPSFNGEYEIFPMASADQIPFTSDTGQMTSGKWMALYEKETIGIGATIIRINILEQSLSAYRNTSQSTRNLYVNLTLLNDTYQGGVKARVYLEVYNESGTQIGSTAQRDTPSTIPAGGSYLMTTSVDLGSLGNLRSAFSVRARCIPIEVTGNVAETSAATTVTDGPSPYT